jgi:hypothetical protein
MNEHTIDSATNSKPAPEVAPKRKRKAVFTALAFLTAVRLRRLCGGANAGRPNRRVGFLFYRPVLTSFPTSFLSSGGYGRMGAQACGRPIARPR